MREVKGRAGSADPGSVGFGFRRRRLRGLLAIIRSIAASRDTAKIRICDLGGAAHYWRAFPFDQCQDLEFSIDLVNRQIHGTDPELSASNVELRFIEGDVCDLKLANQLPENDYLLAHSNSVIEHVGGWTQMLKMAEVTRTVAPYRFVQTPNFWFPVEPHFRLLFNQHLPMPIQTSRVMRRHNLSLIEANNRLERTRLLSTAEMRALFPGDTLIREKFVGLTKSIMVTNVSET